MNPNQRRREGIQGGGSFLALMLFFFSFSSHATAEQTPTWAWRVGDDPAWAHTDHDDADWLQGETPERLLLLRYPYRAWYRFHFTLPEARPEGGWGIALGRIQTADEVYLNGVLIGGEGRVDNHFVDALHKKRVYALPDACLRPGVNILAIRVQSTFLVGGLVSESIALGDYRMLEKAAENEAAPRKQMEAFFLGMLAVAFLFWILFIIYRVHQSEYIYLGAVVALFMGTCTLESLLWYDAGGATPFTQRLTTSLYLLHPIPLLLYSARLFHGVRPPYLHYAWAGLSIGLSVLFLSLGGLDTVRAVEAVWWLSLMITGGLLLWQAWRLRIWRQAAIPLTLAIGMTLLLILALSDALIHARMAPSLPFDFLLYVGFACLIVSLVVAMTIRVRGMNERLLTLSEQILTAQETAAARTAAALHNELAPGLAAAKLDLQLFLRRHQLLPEGEHLVGQLSEAIDQTRTLSHEMHPGAVDQLGLQNALQALSERLATAQGWTLHVDLPEEEPLVGTRATLLYRMGQELLYNAAKYAHASAVDVQLVSNRRGMRLTVRDNGKGCDLRNTQPGIGWTSICERTEAMHGHCYFCLAPGGGMEANIWIPHH